MSRSQTPYSLRSQCRRTACDCRNKHDLPCRRKSTRTNSFNTSASDITPSGSPTPYAPSDSSDVGFSEEFDFDDSSTSSSPRISDKLSQRGSSMSTKSAYSLKLSSFSDKSIRSSGTDVTVNSTSTLTFPTTPLTSKSSQTHNDGMISYQNQKIYKNGGGGFALSSSSGSGYMNSSVHSNSASISNRTRFGEELEPSRERVSWFLKFLKWIGFPVYWCIVHLVLLEKWLMSRTFKRYGLEDNSADSFQNNYYRGESSHQAEEALRHQEGRATKTRRSSYYQGTGNGTGVDNYYSTPTTAGAATTGHSAAVTTESNERFSFSKNGLFGGKIFGMQVTRIFSSSISESGRFLSAFTSKGNNAAVTEGNERTIGGPYSSTWDNSNDSRGGRYTTTTRTKSNTSESGRHNMSTRSNGSDSGRLMGQIKRAGSETGRLGGTTKGTMLVWKKNGRIQEEDEEEQAEFKSTRLRSQQGQAHLDHQRQLSSGFVLGNSNLSGSASVDGFKITNGRMQKKGRGWNSNSLIESDDEDDYEEAVEGSSFGICGNCLRLFVVLGMMAILLYLAYLLWPAATSLAYWTSAFVTSCLSTLVSGCSGAFSLVTSSLPIWASDFKPVNDPPKVPSLDSIVKRTGDGDNLVMEEVAKSTPVVIPPAISKEDYDNIIQKLQMIEKTLEVHQEKLSFHEIGYTKLQQQIVQLDAAMKAVTAKGKSSDQIFYEIMHFKIGETLDGQAVTLKSLMTIQKEHDKEAEVKLDQKLHSMAEKFKTETQSLEERLIAVDGKLKMVKDQNKVVTETKIVAAEVDLGKLKDSIMPDLMAAMENQVKISCLTRDCPELNTVSGGHAPHAADVEKLINMAISKYDADKTGIPDLALESAGGSILSTRCTKSSKLRNSVVSLWGFRIWSPPNNPRIVIQPGVVPGECWAFEGSMGDVVIRLVAPSIVTGFTVEHIPKIISPYGNIDSAPYKFQVLGLHGEEDLDTAHDYGTFSYEDNGVPLQYFSASNITTTPYPIVELKILSNHGNLLHTCLYRFRVHGALAIDGSHFTATVQTASDV